MRGDYPPFMLKKSDCWYSWTGDLGKVEPESPKITENIPATTSQFHTEQSKRKKVSLWFFSFKEISWNLIYFCLMFFLLIIAALMKKYGHPHLSFEPKKNKKEWKNKVRKQKGLISSPSGSYPILLSWTAIKRTCMLAA